MAALSPSEYAHFHAFGFVVRRALFSPAEMQTISDEFDEAITAARPYGRAGEGEHLGFDETARFSTDMGAAWRGRPFVGELASEGRIQGPITQLLGEGACLEPSIAIDCLFAPPLAESRAADDLGTSDQI
jgi:hypothetical protein